MDAERPRKVEFILEDVGGKVFIDGVDMSSLLRAATFDFAD